MPSPCLWWPSELPWKNSRVDSLGMKSNMEEQWEAPETAGDGGVEEAGAQAIHKEETPRGNLKQ